MFNRLVILLLGLFLCVNMVYAQNCCQNKSGACPLNSECVKKKTCESQCDYSPEHAVKYKRFIKKMEGERAIVDNALNLTEEQVKYRQDLFKSNEAFYNERFATLEQECYRMKALKQAGASEKELSNQKSEIVKIKKSIKKCLKSENKEFRRCLTPLQRSKYKEIQKLERQEFERPAKSRDYYKENPQMLRFGNPESCPCKQMQDVK